VPGTIRPQHLPTVWIIIHQTYLLYTCTYNSPNVSAIHLYVTTHNPNNFNFRYFYNHPYFIFFYSRVKFN
jgi:hypothetical protein